MIKKERILIKDVVLDKNIILSGFVKYIRNKKNICFIVLEDFSGKIQLTIDKTIHKNELINNINIGFVIEAHGIVKRSDFVKLNGIEMIVEKLKILSEASPSPIIPPSNKTETNIDLRLDYRWIDLRSEEKILMFKVQTEIINIFRKILLTKGFIEIHTPKIISTESESGAGVFSVDYFGKKAFLAQSPQFYKQMAMAAGFERIFETGPVFRAEKSNSRKHATEFSGFDIEMSYINSFYDIMELEENMIISSLKKIKTKYGEKIKKLYNVDIVIPKTKIPIIKLNDLYEELEKLYNYHVKDEEKVDLTTEAEKLCERFSEEKYNSEFIFIVGFPPQKRAFYHMRDEQGLTCGYDLIWKGVEITTGAQREHRYEILKKQAEEKGIQNDIKDYINFFKYGCPPHGGFGLGIDRLTLVLFNSTIKESMFLFRGVDRLNP